MSAQTGRTQIYSPAMQDYPRNQWYVAAWSSEVGRELLARQFLDVPVVLYRTEAGQPVALADTCPHRSFPLSKGKLIGDVVQCGYHGMEFGPQGKCVRIPQQETIPARMATRSFPLIEKWQWIWIWMGDTAKADPALLPDHLALGLERPGYYATPFCMVHIKANYQFMHDNLLDTSHVSFLHAGLLDAGDLAGSEFWTEEEPAMVRLVRRIRDCRPDAALSRFLRTSPGHSYVRTMRNEAVLPSLSTGRNRMESASGDQPMRDHAAMHALTPSSHGAHYMFHVQITNFEPNWLQSDFDGVRHLIEQDRLAIEAIQERCDQFGPALECSVKSDHSALIFRRRLAEMIKLEKGDVSAPGAGIPSELVSMTATT